MTVDLPAQAVIAGAVPEVCARHGQPATRRRRTVFRSHTPKWTYLLLLFGVLPFAIVAFALQRQVKAPSWPFCPDCGRLRTRRVLLGIGLVLLAVAGVIAFAALLPPENSYAGTIMVVFVVLLIAGLGTASTASSASIASGYVSNDGDTVHVRRAHQIFGDRVMALLSRPPLQTHPEYPPAGSPHYPPPATPQQYGTAR
jgi:hypothetical protein